MQILRLLPRSGVWRAIMLAVVAIPCARASAQSAGAAADREQARAIFKELIEINTTPSVGNTRLAAEAMAARLRSAGYPDKDIAIVGPPGNRQNLIVRLHGAGAPRKALLLLAHTDVVEANRADWSSDPFVFREDSGSFYGRGASDNKAGAAMLVANMMRMKREGFVPDRDIILLLTTDEETDAIAGAQYVIKHHRDLIDAEFCLNTDGGGVDLRDGKYIVNVVGASEKVYQSFVLEVRNRGGHSSIPRPDNADLPALEGAGEPVDLPVSRTAQRCHPVDVRADGEEGRRYDGSRHACSCGSGRKGNGRGATSAKGPDLQLVAAHHMRGHDASRRTRRQRTPSAGPGDR